MADPRDDARQMPKNEIVRLRNVHQLNEKVVPCWSIWLSVETQRAGRFGVLGRFEAEESQRLLNPICAAAPIRLE